MTGRVARAAAPVCLLALILATGFGSSLRAHPGSTTAVVITVRGQNTIDIAFHTDARALVAKVEAISNAPLTKDERSRLELASRIAALSTTLVDEIDLHAEGTRAAVTFASADVDEAGQAVVRLSGTVPMPSKTVTWSTSLVYGAYPISLRTTSGHETVRWLAGRETSEALPLIERGSGTAIWPGVRLGFTHILPHGLDHILFVVGLVLLGTRLGPLLAHVSAFTLAHSVTLGLCLYGVVSLPSRIVEPLIALSVAYVGLENLFAKRLTRWRVVVVFVFGLLHGLGFAEALAALNLSRADLLSTLVSFNVGVELGQMTVVAVVWAVVYGVLRAWRQPVARVVSAGIATMGVAWTVQRLFA